MSRVEFGVQRTSCGCAECVLNCMFMPGFLIPSDLARMIPTAVLSDPFPWAESNLLASPGALVMHQGEFFRVRTLVPAVKGDGSCIHLTGELRCAVHENAPFGCAFFDCKTEPGDLMSSRGVMAVYRAWLANDLYAMLWRHLDALGLRQMHADVLRERMRRKRHMLKWIVSHLGQDGRSGGGS